MARFGEATVAKSMDSEVQTGTDVFWGRPVYSEADKIGTTLALEKTVRRDAEKKAPPL